MSLGEEGRIHRWVMFAMIMRDLDDPEVGDQAAVFWAQARQAGRPTAPDLALDADAILAGQAATLRAGDPVIATTNEGHLSRFVAASQWHTIQAR